ncbi:HEAT repeat domain-containing protein [Candidatus Uabimicrobium sp. HlEnr_7]|uniref:HEAT repeat domain-containing protein n=1 Tax=Candidatus Uabimicrobium helgolandensis TaxID=3095367 RepID=UPI0035579FD4
MNKILIVALIFVTIACKTQSTISATNESQNSEEIVVIWPEGTQNTQLSQSEIDKIRSLLDVYYSGNKNAWAKSRAQIVAMGPAAKKALCLFFIKFFAAGRQSVGDLEKHWRASRYELSLLKEFSVPFLISTMAIPKLGTTGKIQCSKTLAIIGSPAVPALIENLGRGEPSFQRRIVETLGEIKDVKAITPLAALYNNQLNRVNDSDSQYGVRVYCMEALGKIRWNKESTTTVEKALSDPNKDVRKAAIEAAILMAASQNAHLLKKAQKTSRKDFPLSRYHSRIEVLLYAYK